MEAVGICDLIPPLVQVNVVSLGLAGSSRLFSSMFFSTCVLAFWIRLLPGILGSSSCALTCLAAASLSQSGYLGGDATTGDGNQARHDIVWLSNLSVHIDAMLVLRAGKRTEGLKRQLQGYLYSRSTARDRGSLAC